MNPQVLKTISAQPLAKWEKQCKFPSIRIWIWLFPVRLSTRRLPTDCEQDRTDAVSWYGKVPGSKPAQLFSHCFHPTTRLPMEHHHTDNHRKEHYYTRFFDYIAQVLVLPEEDKASIRQSFKPCFVPADTILEPAGRVPLYHNFIVSGYMRNFHLDSDQNQVTTDLNDGPRFFTSYFHFMNRTVSDENLHCITDCELLRISRDDVDATASTSTTQKDYTILILQKHLEEEKTRITDMTTLTAEDRYRKFLRQRPSIIHHVPLGYIASYLGITQRHLSRLRRQTDPNSQKRK